MGVAVARDVAVAIAEEADSFAFPPAEALMHDLEVGKDLAGVLLIRERIDRRKTAELRELLDITLRIGADDRAVMRTVIAEGIVIGSISFALAIVLSVPFTYGLSAIVSLAVFQTPIDVVFTYLGYSIWLALVLVLSTVASILPARNAARLTIREVLAYE